MRFAVNKDIKSFRQYLQFFNRTEWIDDEYWILGASIESVNDELLAYGVLYFNNGHRVNNLSASCLGNFYTSDSEAAPMLLKKVFEIAIHIAPVIIGPMNGSTWASYRFMTPAHAEPFYLEPTNPPEYNQHFKATGFTELSQYGSSVINSADGFTSSPHIGNLDYIFKNFDTDTFDNEIRKIHLISNTAFKNNFLFTEINYNKFYNLYVPLKGKINAELFIIAYKDEIPVGFVFGYPDFLCPEKNRVVLKTLGRLPGKEYSGLGTMLLGKFTKMANEKGFASIIHALMPMDKVSIRMSEMFGGKISNTYALYSKLLK